MLVAILIIITIVIIVLIKLIGGTQKADVYVTVKSRQTLEKYDAIKFFRENSEKLTESNEGTYIIRVHYVSPAGRKSAIKDIAVRQYDIDRFKNDPSSIGFPTSLNVTIFSYSKTAF